MVSGKRYSSETYNGTHSESYGLDSWIWLQLVMSIVVCSFMYGDFISDTALIDFPLLPPGAHSISPPSELALDVYPTATSYLSPQVSHLDSANSITQLKLSLR